MAGLDRRIDPATGDYIDDGRGGYEDTKSIETAAWHQLKGRRGQWWGDGDAGSFLHTLAERNLNDITLGLAENFAKQALQIFVDEGMARDLTVIVDVADDNPNRLFIETEITDVQFGRIDLTDQTEAAL